VAAVSRGDAQWTDSIWTQAAPLLEPYSEIAVTGLNDRIYVLGGYPSTRVYVDTVQVYDSATDRWDYTTPLPQPMHHTMVATVNGRLYAIGGEISRTGVADVGVYLDTVYAYDPASETWTQKASMPTPRSAGSADVIDGKIYVAGGRPPHGQTSRHTMRLPIRGRCCPTCLRSATTWQRQRSAAGYSSLADASAAGWAAK
jgi:N-acetylneuraminic acid mutarotase